MTRPIRIVLLPKHNTTRYRPHTAEGGFAMEQFVKMLYDRLEGKKDLQLQLYCIMQNAINEMHNNGVVGTLTGEAARAVHDPDPEIRVLEKTRLAKSVGKTFIPTAIPVPSQGGLSYLAQLNYNSKFVNSITLCFQGGIEGLYMTFRNSSNTKLDKYIIQIASGDQDISALKKNIELLDSMYDDISIVLMRDGEIVHAYDNADRSRQPSQPQESRKKSGFFAKLFGKT